MLLVSLISYVDRHTLAILSPTILRDCGLSGEQYGYIISAFSLTYMAGNPVWGRWLDRYGIRWGMLAAVSLWTFASTTHAFIGSFASFVLARALLGFGEGATFPGALRTVVETLPPNLRARGTALAYSGGSLGAVVTPLIVTPIYQWFGWRAAFWFTGLIGAGWLAMWWFVSKPIAPSKPESSPPSKQLAIRFSDMRVWSFMITYAMGGLPLAFVLYQSALYFSRALGRSQVEIGAVMWIPPLGWEAGYFLWAWMADRMRTQGVETLAVYRRLTWLGVVLIVPLAAVPYVDSFPGVLLLLFLAMLVAGGNVITAVGYATDLYGPGSAGFIAGLGAGCWSGFVALTMPVFGRMLDQRRYPDAFGLATAAALAGFLFWLWVNRRQRAQ